MRCLTGRLNNGPTTQLLKCHGIALLLSQGGSTQLKNTQAPEENERTANRDGQLHFTLKSMLRWTDNFRTPPHYLTDTGNRKIDRQKDSRRER